MMLKAVLLIVIVILLLFSYLIYTDYRDNVIFRGETFKESKGIRQIIDFLIPSGVEGRILDNKTFYLSREKTVRDFYVIKLISLCFFIVMSFSIVYTNYLNDKSGIYENTRTLPFSISSSEFDGMIEGLTFEQMDRIQDLNKLNSNLKYLENYNKFMVIDINVLYDTVFQMNKDFNNLFGFSDVAVAIALIFAGWALPNITLNLLYRLLLSNMDFEYAKLEGYIYLNSNERVQLVATGLCRESVVYRNFFNTFLQRYNEDNLKAYDLVLDDSGLNYNFKSLVEYLKLLDNTTPEKVREKILVNQRNHLNALKNKVRNSNERKKDMVSRFLLGSMVINLIGIGVSLITGLTGL